MIVCCYNRCRAGLLFCMQGTTCFELFNNVFRICFLKKIVRIFDVPKVFGLYLLEKRATKCQGHDIVSISDRFERSRWIISGASLVRHVPYTIDQICSTKVSKRCHQSRQSIHDFRTCHWRRVQWWPWTFYSEYTVKETKKHSQSTAARCSYTDYTSPNKSLFVTFMAH